LCAYLRVLKDSGNALRLDGETKELLVQPYSWIAFDCFHYHGQTEVAAEYLDFALTLVPDHPVALGAKGVLLRVTGHVDAGLELTRQAVALHPDSPVAWRYLGQYYMDMGEWTKSEGAWRRALELDASLDWVNERLALVLVRQGRCSEALPFVQQVLDFRLGDEKSRAELLKCGLDAGK
jgi:tetratricopeptide (TPR) repeat protein